MIDKTQQHPFLRSPLSYFEVWTNEKEELPENHLHVQELQWRDFNRLKNHPYSTVFYGRDVFYSVYVVTISDVSKCVLRDIATDIYHGKYQRREVNMRRI